MVDMNNFIDFTFIKLKRISIGQSVCLLTFKKDRKVTILKESDDTFTLFENGFFKETYEDLNFKHLKKLLKSMVKKEFPRSNKLHLIEL